MEIWAVIGPVQATTSGIVQDLILKYRQSPLTWILLLLIWVVEIFGRFVADSKMDLNEMMGIQLSEPWTYISYAFAHRDMEHILGNSILLLFGMAAESYYGSKAFLGIVGFSIVLGALGALVFYFSSGEPSDEPIVGASAIGQALLIAGINAIAQARVTRIPIGVRGFWIRAFVKWFLLIAVLSGMPIFAKGIDFTIVLTIAVTLGVILGLTVVGLKAILYQVQYWELGQRGNIQLRTVQAIRLWLIPLLLFGILLHGEITGTTEWFYGNSGHAGGAVVGLMASLWGNWLSWRKPTRYIRAEMTATSSPKQFLFIGTLLVISYLIFGIYSAWTLLVLTWRWVSGY